MKTFISEVEMPEISIEWNPHFNSEEDTRSSSSIDIDKYYTELLTEEDIIQVENSVEVECSPELPSICGDGFEDTLGSYISRDDDVQLVLNAEMDIIKTLISEAGMPGIHIEWDPHFNSEEDTRSSSSIDIYKYYTELLIEEDIIQAESSVEVEHSPKLPRICNDGFEDSLGSYISRDDDVQFVLNAHINSEEDTMSCNSIDINEYSTQLLTEEDIIQVENSADVEYSPELSDTLHRDVERLKSSPVALYTDIEKLKSDISGDNDYQDILSNANVAAVSTSYRDDVLKIIGEEYVFIYSKEDGKLSSSINEHKPLNYFLIEEEMAQVEKATVDIECCSELPVATCNGFQTKLQTPPETSGDVLNADDINEIIGKGYVLIYSEEDAKSSSTHLEKPFTYLQRKDDVLQVETSDEVTLANGFKTMLQPSNILEDANYKHISNAAASEVNKPEIIMEEYDIIDSDDDAR